MPPTETTIDPYERLLRIKSNGKPLDYYALLKLDPFERDLNYIRSYGERARKQLHSKFGEIDPALWRQVFNDVEDAIATLTDPDKKLAYDQKLETETGGAVKLVNGQNGHNGHDGHAPKPADQGERIECRQCATPNAPSRRFCSSCGDALYLACPDCGGMNTVYERFCGQCGVNLQASVEAQRQAIEEKFSEADALLKDGRHDRACDLLRTLTKATHEGEVPFAKRAAALITEITLDKERLLAKAPEIEAEAKALRNARQAEKAYALIRQIPQPLRGDGLRELFNEVSEVRQEIKRLTQEIKQALQTRRTARLLPKVERLLDIKPHDISAQRLAEKLRSSQDQADRLKRAKLIQRAKEYLSQGRYERAHESLSEVPDSVRSENFLKYFNQVSELAFLSADLRKAVYADATLVGFASRLVKLMPKDNRALERLHKLTQRLEQLAKDPAANSPVWNEPPKETTLGVPIDVYRRFRNFDTSAVATQEVYTQYASAFAVAAGLALQGLGQARVQMNLLPTTTNGVLAMLGAADRTPTADLAWGIDLSNSGLKAILLRKIEQGETTVRVEQMVKVDYKRPLSRADDADRRGLIKEAVETFFDKVGKVAFTEKRGKCIVCLNLPATEVVGRFLALPPVDNKKIPKTVEYELRHQVPFPLEELSWDYHLWDEEAAPEQTVFDSSIRRRCVAVATRRSKLQEKLAFLRGLGITPKIVQADQLAIYNFFNFDLFSDPEVQQKLQISEQAIGLLDVGSDASHLIVAGLHSIWFRSLEVGGENFTRILVRQMSRTYDKAEELKRRPDTADEIFKLYEVLTPVLKKLAKEAAHSANAYRSLGEDQLSEIRLIGGGSNLHGLLHFLHYGKFLDV